MIDVKSKVVTVKPVDSKDDHDNIVVVSLDLDKVKPEPCDHFLNLSSLNGGDNHKEKEEHVEELSEDLFSSMDFVEYAAETYTRDVTSSTDAANQDEKLWDFIDSDEFDMVEQYSFLWGNFADETVSTTAATSTSSPSTATTNSATSPITTPLANVTSATSSDEDTISSSTKPYEDTTAVPTTLPKSSLSSSSIVASPNASSSASSSSSSSSSSSPPSPPPPPSSSSSSSSSSPPSTGKIIASVDCPPDDVGAFFGHPLTRATSALNGEDASAVALLHEYINLPAIEIKEEPKEEDRLDGYLSIISGPKPDPSLSHHVDHGEESCNSLQGATPPPESNLQGDLPREVVMEDGVVVASHSGEVMVMPEYINMFLQEDFRLEKFLIDEQTSSDRHAGDLSSSCSPSTSSSPSSISISISTPTTPPTQLAQQHPPPPPSPIVGELQQHHQHQPHPQHQCSNVVETVVSGADERMEDSETAVTSATTKTKKAPRKQNSHIVSRRVTETKRAPRKSRAKSDVTTHVTSTTNGVPRILTKCPATIVSHPSASTELVSTNFKDESVPEGAVLKEVIAPPLSASAINSAAAVLVTTSTIQSHNNISNPTTFNTAAFSADSPVVVIHSNAPPQPHHHNHHHHQHSHHLPQQQQLQQSHHSIQQQQLSQIDRQKQPQQQPHQVIVTSVPKLHNGDIKPAPILISSGAAASHINSTIATINTNATTSHQQQQQLISTKQPLSRSFSLGSTSNNKNNNNNTNNSNNNNSASKDIGNEAYAQLVKENSLLKKALSEKIRSRQAEEVAMPSQVAHHQQHQTFLTDDVSIMNLDIKYPPVKQEDPYVGFEPQYTYDPVTMTTCGDGLQQHFTNSSIDASFIQPQHCNTLQQQQQQQHHHHPHQQQHQHHHNPHLPPPPPPPTLPPHCISNSIGNHTITTSVINTTTPNNSSNNSPCLTDSMIINSQGQCFQVLQPLQTLDSNLQGQSHHHQPAIATTNTTTTANNIQNNSSNNISNSNNNDNNNNNNSDANNSYFNYVYQRGLTPQLMETDKQVVVERYLQQQHHYTYNNSNNNNNNSNNNSNSNNNNSSNSTNGYVHFLNDSNYSMKSPDSGFHDTCPSPNAGTKLLASHLPDQVSSAINGGGVLCEAEASKEKPKKKKPSSGFPSAGAEKVSSRAFNVKKLDINTTGYSYVLESPISTTQRRDEDRVTYLNKSQYYGLTFNFSNQDRIMKCSSVKSVIMLVFREERPMDEERRAWEFWHSRQHSYKQRILDIDTKNCQGVVPQNIEEIAFNAVSVKWNPQEGPVRVNIAVHCLSTDFSNQKGVKGIPLHVQIDTYEHSLTGTQVVHRGFCQIKAFCDKGAERKTRDEERRRAAKVKPNEATPPVIGIQTAGKSRKKADDAFHEPCDKSDFYSMADTLTPPVFFNPTQEYPEYVHKSLVVGVVPAQEDEISSLPTCVELPDSCDDLFCSPSKRPRRDSNTSQQNFPKVLLYVRERHETVYTALMLEVPTLYGLLKSIEEKYSIQPSKMKNVYKKSKKGILVKLDDNIIRHYSNESTFIIEMNQLNDDKDQEIILTEIDPVAV